MSLPEIKTILYTTSLGKHTRPGFPASGQDGQPLQSQNYHAACG